MFQILFDRIPTVSNANYTLLWHYSDFGARNLSQADEIVTLLTPLLHLFLPAGSIIKSQGIDALMKIRYLDTTRRTPFILGRQ
jgi:hypothetical protein